MVRDKSTAVPHELLEGGLHRCRPHIAIGKFIVIRDHELILRDVGMEAAEVAALRRSSRHIYLKQAAALQNDLQNWSGVLPVVIVLPVDNEGVNRPRARCGPRGQCQKKSQVSG